MRRVLALSAVAVFALTSAVAAQDRGTQADQDACTPDVFRLCSAYIPNEPSIVSCLQSKRQSLSQACYSVFYPRHAARDLDMTPTGSIGAARLHTRRAPHAYHRISTGRRGMRPAYR